MSGERQQMQRALGEQFGRQLGACTRLFHQAMAERLGLNTTDLKCLDLAHEETDLTAGRLAELAGLTTAAVTSVIDRLERAGFVRRERDERDRRKVIVRPVPERRPEVEGLFAALDESLSQLCEQYSTGELALVYEFATQVGDIMRSQAVELRGQADEASEPEKPPAARAAPGGDDASEHWARI